MTTLSAILSQLASGLTYGMILMMVSLGLTLIFGVMGLINFAHGELYALGAYFGFVTISVTGNFWLALIIAPLGVGVVGAALERGFLARLYDSDPIFTLLLTFGLALVIQETIRLIWGSGLKPLSAPAIFSGSVPILGVRMPLYWLFIIVFTLSVTGVVILLLNNTKYGMYIRAASRDSEMVALLGIDNTKVYTGLFAAGAALAGLSGVLIAPLRGVRPVMGTEIIIASFVVVVIGGLGSIGGAILGSILVGVLTSFTTLYFPELSEVAMFVAMIAVLLLLPEGLMGEKGRVE